MNIYGIGDRMSKKGWHLNAIADPAGLHMAFTVSFTHEFKAYTQRLSAESVNKLLDDLGASIKEEKEAPATGGNLVALYGVGQTSVGPMMVEEVAKSFLDVLYE